MAAVPVGQAPAGPVPHWPTNAAGETYGSALDGQFPGDEPDLISAWTTEWTVGYVRRTELDIATGASVVRNPADALAWNAKVAAMIAAGERVFVPVYEQDGVTVIGQHEIQLGGGSTGQHGDGSPPPTTIPHGGVADDSTPWYYGLSPETTKGMDPPPPPERGPKPPPIMPTPPAP
ncbi:hypothetical protein I6A84_32785 [Frankia sp. CNm7]|uniref:Uncharacterized protein n=1 Tax=Frankia nepalensis TaxID=1836974 RepID=A0A937RDS0_9ACTN|nr:hypothetical protein [Frankia nepalensis]MBL7498638.1 hypothetical protein [Frankia nepalensis]MBL7509196.1 hypothetical protein [Frankia nepalensis]MBL7522734.1 hypothetical protein [Frankia nepalensis]MBL7628387.1 hypothetical protein [Frankia nepalensis]